MPICRPSTKLCVDAVCRNRPSGGPAAELLHEPAPGWCSLRLAGVQARPPAPLALNHTVLLLNRHAAAPHPLFTRNLQAEERRLLNAAGCSDLVWRATANFWRVGAVVFALNARDFCRPYFGTQIQNAPAPNWLAETNRTCSLLPARPAAACISLQAEW